MEPLSPFLLAGASSSSAAVASGQQSVCRRGGGSGGGGGMGVELLMAKQICRSIIKRQQDVPNQ